MIAVEIITAVLIASLAIVMAYAGIVGLLGILGAVRFIRCDRCGHLGVTSPTQRLRSCVHCRHGMLHPLDKWHLAHAKVVQAVPHLEAASDRARPFSSGPELSLRPVRLSAPRHQSGPGLSLR